MKVLLDHSVPRGLRAFLTGFEIKHAFEMGWHELRNGDLLNEAERSGFAVLITADRNLRYQKSARQPPNRHPGAWDKPLADNRTSRRSYPKRVGALAGGRLRAGADAETAEA